jgi:hypothetical protein
MVSVPVSFNGDDTHERMQRLRSLLLWQQEQTSTQRRALTIAGLTGAGLCLGVGVLASRRNDTGSQVMGLSVGAIGAGFLLGTLISSLGSSPWDAVTEPMQAARARFESDANVLSLTERTWQERAEKAQRGRHIGGIVLAIFSGALVVTGTVLMLVEPRRTSTRDNYRILGASSLMLGSASGLAAASVLTVAEPLEAGWESYRRTVPSLSVGISPVEGGAVAGVSGSF